MQFFFQPYLVPTIWTQRRGKDEGKKSFTFSSTSFATLSTFLQFSVEEVRHRNLKKFKGSLRQSSYPITSAITRK
jgi:hypothetical protein